MAGVVLAYRLCVCVRWMDGMGTVGRSVHVFPSVCEVNVWYG
jgi:hypothetical protein